MIALLGNSQEMNREMKKLVRYLDLPCLYADLYGMTGDKAFTPWNYYAAGGPQEEGEPLFWLDLKGPSAWSFRTANFISGQIFEGEKLLANVYFREPFEDQCLDRVEWIKGGEVYARDFYDASGFLCARAILQMGKESLVKYYDRDGRPSVISWPELGYVSVKRKGQEVIFESTDALYRAFLQDLVSEQEKKAVLFYEPALLKFLPGDTKKVLFVQDKVPEEMKERAFREALSLMVTAVPGSEAGIRRFYDGEISPEVLEMGSLIDKGADHPAENALIVTRSQYIEQLQALAEGLPELHFHVAAPTMMAPGLMAFDRYENVTLYPCSPPGRIADLMEKCAFYLDISHYLEYEGIVRAAIRKDLLVFAFDNTVHQRTVMPEGHIYGQEQADRMISDISRAMFDPRWLEECLEAQRKGIEMTKEQREEIRKKILDL